MRLFKGLLFIAIITLVGCKVNPNPGNQTNCGNKTTLFPDSDSDRDGIYDLIEKANNMNSIDVCDPDPTVAVGTYNSGSLTGGLKLPGTGVGYYHWAQSSGHIYGTLGLLTCITEVGMAWGSITIPSIGVQHLSPQNGGAGSNPEHQNGLAVDIMYVSNDGNPVLDIAFEPNRYDKAATIKLINYFLQNIGNCKVAAVIVDLANCGFTNNDLQYAVLVDGGSSYSNHFTVKRAK